MKKAILTFLAIMACSLCVFTSCSKNNDNNKVAVRYEVVATGNTSSQIWGNYERSMNAAIEAAVEIWEPINGLSYESEANDKAAIKACDEVYAKGGEVDFDFTLALRKAYVAKVESETKSTILKTYVYKATKKQ